jgi:hypothetical protein
MRFSPNTPSALTCVSPYSSSTGTLRFHSQSHPSPDVFYSSHLGWANPVMLDKDLPSVPFGQFSPTRDTAVPQYPYRKEQNSLGSPERRPFPSESASMSAACAQSPSGFGDDLENDGRPGHHGPRSRTASSSSSSGIGKAAMFKKGRRQAPSISLVIPDWQQSVPQAQHNADPGAFAPEQHSVARYTEAQLRASPIQADAYAPHAPGLALTPPPQGSHQNYQARSPQLAPPSPRSSNRQHPLPRGPRHSFTITAGPNPFSPAPAQPTLSPVQAQGETTNPSYPPSTTQTRGRRISAGSRSSTRNNSFTYASGKQRPNSVHSIDERTLREQKVDRGESQFECECRIRKSSPDPGNCAQS